MTASHVGPQTSQNHYETLQVAYDASLPEIKAAYHRILLTSHPDKASRQAAKYTDNAPSEEFDVARLQEAYKTLSSPERRIVYDQTLAQVPTGRGSILNSGPRPAQIVSLEEFDHQDNSERNEHDVWTYPCRCGGQYAIAEEEMEADQHLVACGSCSEAIYVGYEVIEESDQGGLS